MKEDTKMNYAGIDLGMAYTAIVIIDKDKKMVDKYHFGVKVNDSLKGATHAHPAVRYSLYAKYLSEYIEKNKDKIDAVVIERPFGNTAGHAYKLYELFGVYLVTLTKYFPSINIHILVPTAIKKYFCKDGSANKDMMVSEAKKRGYKVRHHHDADALAMALMGSDGKA